MPRALFAIPVVLLAAFFLSSPVLAHGQEVQTATVAGGAEKLPYLDELPPLIDREIFFGNPEISGGQLSPDGRWVSFVKPLDGIRNVWVKAIDEPFDAARPMTADSLRPVQGYFWSRDSKVILFVQDQGGNENFHVYGRGGDGRATGSGLRGDSTAIAAARTMVEAMGGVRIWKPLKSVRLVHEWFPWNRSDSYIETETLDLTGPRSHADRKSEISHEIRAYGPEGGGWRIQDGKLTTSSPSALAADLARAPFNFYHLVSAVAKDDPFYEVRWGKGDIPGTRQLEFYGPDGRLGGWVILNVDGEPIVKATPQYRYILGPLQRFGNLRLPAWGVYENGYTRYEMRSANGDHEPLDPALFLVPAMDRD